MNNVNYIINKCGVSKVKIAKYLGVSRQMLYNYLALDNINDIPKDKLSKLLNLFNISNEKDLEKIKIDDNYIREIEARINDNILETSNKLQILDFKGLTKKEHELLSSVFSLLKDKISNNKDENAYHTIKYLYHFIQNMDYVPEFKYILVYMDKMRANVPALEFVYDEDKQYTFEGILHSAMTLYISGTGSKIKIAESHKKFEQEIEQKKEEQLSRTEELNTFKKIALSELGYTSINDSNAKEVFEKIAEIMSGKL